MSPHHFRYEHCDIPEGVTLGEHRRAKLAARRTGDRRRPRGLRRLLVKRTAEPARA